MNTEVKKNLQVKLKYGFKGADGKSHGVLNFRRKTLGDQYWLDQQVGDEGQKTAMLMHRINTDQIIHDDWVQMDETDYFRVCKAFGEWVRPDMDELGVNPSNGTVSTITASATQ